ncbi:hypothetical protein [Streptomyces fagopyri]|uniref:hypothetical protein n=1 Tax=Streptomyces fagopyri TaxID=2662397 RepID=UPI0037159C0E
MERQTRTRKPTPAEIHAARVLGQPDPEAIEVETTSTAVLHAARVADQRKSAKPKDMPTADWYALRARGGEDPDPAA